MKKILVKSREQETNIVYTFLLNREDADNILEKEGIEYLEIEGGWVGFKGETITIKQNSSPAFLNAKEVLNQIQEQL